MGDLDFLIGMPDVAGRPLTHVPTKIGPGVSAFIFDVDGRILMEKRSDSGLWGLPGGSMEIGESAEEAVVREVAEETGLEVEVERLLGVHTDPRKGAVAAYPDGNVVHFVSIVFECRRLSGDLRISHESTDLAYFAVDELPDDIVQGHLMRIQNVTSGLPTPFIR